jgi:hypothetical protein
MASRITDVTRRRVIEGLAATAWYGALNEVEFLDRLYELDTLPTTDPRSAQFPTAREDITQHSIANYDWKGYWIFDDERFGLATSDDALLRFLAEMLHPAVRTNLAEVEQLHSLFNQILTHDGYEIVQIDVISGAPTFAGRRIGAGVRGAMKHLFSPPTVPNRRSSSATP